VWAGEDQRQVLVLHSTRRDGSFSILADRELPRLLDERRDLDYYSEHIDLPRFSEPGYQAAFRDFLRRKYRGHRFDLVFAMLDTAIEFVRSNRNELFPDTPVVFLANRAPIPMPNATGIIAESNFKGTVAFAAKLQPDLQQVFVVTGASPRDRAYEAETRAEFQRAGFPFTFTHLSGLPSGELERTLETLPPHSMVYMVVFYQDGAGENFHPAEYANRVASVASAPTYSWLDSMMGHGIVGGSLLSEEAEVNALAGVALRILHGEKAETIPASTADVAVNQVDWRQLRRWGISEARLPAGTVVRFREFDVWERFKGYIVGAIVLLIGQSFLIGTLLVQRKRRRRAEQKAYQSEAELRVSFDKIRALGGRLLLAQESERARIARELHDGFGQDIALIALTLSALRQQPDLKNSPTADAAVGDLQKRTLQVAGEIHALSHDLHPGALRHLGLAPAVESHCIEIEKRYDVQVSFTAAGDLSHLSDATALGLFRISQEALRNAAVHGGPRRINVSITVSTEHVELTVADDGKGFDVEGMRGDDRGIGLVSMEERASLAGGVMQIVSQPGKGTTICVRAPVRASVQAGQDTVDTAHSADALKAPEVIGDPS
jgi:signal transduction histidine kinase